MKDNFQSSIMNELKINDTYSCLKDSYLILNKELSFMREKNEYHNQQVKDLQSTISSILERTITKEEMKQMIKEGVTPINNVQVEKEKEIVGAETQTEKIDKIITSIKLIKQTKDQHPGWVTCILELLDGRLAVGCGGGAISLNKMNYETKEWKSLAKETKHITMLLLFSED
jgi:hypothetical protein